MSCRTRAAFAVAVASLCLSLFAAAPAAAQTGSELALKPFAKELRLEVNADAYLHENGYDKDTGADFRLSVYETEGRFRLTPGDVASPRVGYAFEYLDLDSAVLGLPDRLADMSVGVATPIAEFEGWVIGLQASVGYAGDSFFGDGDAYYARGSVIAFKQLSDTDALVLGIDYDGNRTFKPDVPLPGFAYSKRIREDLLLTVGIPVTSIEWEPVDKLRIELGYLLVDNVTARVGYEVAPGIEVFGSAAQRSDAFFLDGLQGNDDRLLFQQRRAEVGVTVRGRDAGVGDQDFELTAAVGYAWDGEFSAGFDQSDSDLVADVSDEPYVRLALQVRF